jgi:hypothetical protein
MRDDTISTLSLIAKIAGKAIDRERERRRVTGVTWGSERIEALLLHLTIIKRLACEALPKMERAALPPEKNPELVRRLAQEIREAADERQRKRPVVH